MFIVALSFSFNSNVLSEESAKDIIKKRKSLFSQNYKLAKRISILLNEVEIEDSKKLMIRMSDNYLELLNLFVKINLFEFFYVIYLSVCTPFR